MTPYNDKYRAYAQYLRTRMISEGVARNEDIEYAPDEAIIDYYRRNHRGNKDFYSSEQLNQVIMESNSPEAAFMAAENIKHMDHIEEIEKTMLLKYSSLSGPITMRDNIPIKGILNKIRYKGANIKEDNIEFLVQEVCSIFPGYVLKGAFFEVFESEKSTVMLRYGKKCPGCLLEDTLNQYKTLFVWMKYTLYGAVNDKSEEFKTYLEDVSDYIMGSVYSEIRRSIDNKINLTPWLKRNTGLMNELVGAIQDHIGSISLISCWVHGKARAQKRIMEYEEEKEFLTNVHDFLCPKYHEYHMSNDLTGFLKEVRSLLRPLSFEQVATIYKNDFPVEMADNWSRRVNTVLRKIIEEKVMTGDNNGK